MVLGTQGAHREDWEFRVLAQLGVTHLCNDPPGDWRTWDVDALHRHRERIESFGLTLDMIQLPLSSVELDQERRAQEARAVLSGEEPLRQQELERIQELLAACARAGIPAVKYNLNVLGVPRSARELGRGGSSNSAFRWAAMDQEAPPTSAGRLDADLFWQRIDHFLAHVVPVATEHRVRLACHPHDPHTPSGYRGIDRVLGTVDGLRRFVQMHESPYHGLNFCQGTVGEMLDDPAAEIFDVIRWFATRNKIFNLHFRNITGRRLDFVEVFPDEGDMDMVASLRLYHELGYPYMVMPDHVPHLDGPNAGTVGFAYCYGYIRALLQTLDQ